MITPSITPMLPMVGQKPLKLVSVVAKYCHRNRAAVSAERIKLTSRTFGGPIRSLARILLSPLIITLPEAVLGRRRSKIPTTIEKTTATVMEMTQMGNVHSCI